MELIIVSISPKCIAVYYPFHECGISLKDKSENMQEIDNDQNEIILFRPSSLFINVGLKEITSAYANFLLFEIHQHRRMKSYQAMPLLVICTSKSKELMTTIKKTRVQREKWPLF